MKNVLACVAVLCSTFAALSHGAPAPVPSRIETQPGNVGLIVASSNVVDVPEEILSLPKRPTGSIQSGVYWAHVTLWSNSTCTNSVSPYGVYLDDPGTPDRTLRSDLLDGHKLHGGVFADYNPRGDTIWTEMRVGDTDGNHPRWISECVPVAVTTPAVCKLSDSNIVLDHRSILEGETSTASASATVSCTSAGSGHLALPSGGSTLSVGSGTSTLTTDAGDLSTPRPFARGETPIEIKSRLAGVGPGDWEGSVIIVLVMD